MLLSISLGDETPGTVLFTYPLLPVPPFRVPPTLRAPPPERQAAIEAILRCLMRFTPLSQLPNTLLYSRNNARDFHHIKYFIDNLCMSDAHDFQNSALLVGV